MIREQLNKPVAIGEGFKGGLLDGPQQHRWFIKNEAGEVIVEGVGGTRHEAQKDLESQLLADGLTAEEIRELFKTFIDKGHWTV